MTSGQGIKAGLFLQPRSLHRAGLGLELGLELGLALGLGLGLGLR